MPNNDPGRNRPTLFHAIGSALSAAFGVQSEENRARDFQHGSPKVFLLVGILMTIAFVLLIYAVVRMVLSAAGA